MNNFSNYAEKAILNHSLRQINYIKPSSYWFALFKSNPGETGDLEDELSGGGYDRVEVKNNKKNFPPCLASGAPTKTNGEDILFPVATSPQGTAKFWGLFNGPKELIQFRAQKTADSSVLTVIGNTAGDTSPSVITGIISKLRVGMNIGGLSFPSYPVILAMGPLNDQITVYSAVQQAVSLANPASIPTTGNLGSRNEDKCVSTEQVTITVYPKLIVYSALKNPISIHSSKIAKIPNDTLKITIPQSTKGGLTRYGESKILDLFFGNLPYPSPPSVFTGLGTALVIAGDNNDQMTEVEDAEYTRVETTFGEPSHGICRNSFAIRYCDEASGGYSVNSVGIWDDNDSGRLLWAGFTAKTQLIKSTDVLQLMQYGLSIQMQ